MICGYARYCRWAAHQACQERRTRFRPGFTAGPGCLPSHRSSNCPRGNCSTYSSLTAENRQRQAHMDQALQRLEEKAERLRRACNAQRQEEITEEIEIILLSADAMN